MSTRRTRVRRRSAARRRPVRAAAAVRPAVVEDGGQESLAEAESELGQNEWIDPETGELAQGESPPRLGEE